MTPCLCGEPNCRGIVTGFERLPFELQMQYMVPHHKTHGHVLGHIIHDLPKLENMLRHQAPDRFPEYQQALKVLYTKSAEFQKTIGPSVAPSPDWNH